MDARLASSHVNVHSAFKTKAVWDGSVLCWSFCLRALGLDLALCYVAWMTCSTWLDFCHSGNRYCATTSSGHEVPWRGMVRFLVLQCMVRRRYRNALSLPIPISPISIHFSTSPRPSSRWCLLHDRRVAATTCGRHQRLFPLVRPTLGLRLKIYVTISCVFCVTAIPEVTGK